MLDFNKILWPNDFSKISLRAAPRINELVERTGAEIHLLHVAPDLSDYGHFWGKPDPKHVDGLHDFARRGAKKKLADFCTSEMAACPLYHVHVALGDPAGEILEAIHRTEADLVVLPIDGEQPLGSVAKRVIQYASVPVLTVNTTA